MQKAEPEDNLTPRYVALPCLCHSEGIFPLYLLRENTFTKVPEAVQKVLVSFREMSH